MARTSRPKPGTQITPMQKLRNELRRLQRENQPKPKWQPAKPKPKRRK